MGDSSGVAALLAAVVRCAAFPRAEGLMFRFFDKLVFADRTGQEPQFDVKNVGTDRKLERVLVRGGRYGESNGVASVLLSAGFMPTRSSLCQSDTQTRTNHLLMEAKLLARARVKGVWDCVGFPRGSPAANLRPFPTNARWLVVFPFVRSAPSIVLV